MIRRLQLGVDALFVFTEATAWYYALHVFASMYERSVLSDLAGRIDVAVQSNDGLDGVVGAHAAEVARTAAQVASAGPPWLVILASAASAFALTRFIRSARLGGFGTLLGVLVSAAALMLVWRFVLVGDVRFWDFDSLARFFDSSESASFRPIDVEAFTARPDPDVASGRASGLLLLGVGALWFRFLFAGRWPVVFETVLRSFSATFPVVVLTTVAGSAARVPGGGMALLYFASAVLALALANAVRATDRGEASLLAGARAGFIGKVRAILETPWAFAVVATLLLVAGTGLALTALTLINAGAAALAIGGLMGKVLEVVLVIIVTPIYFLMKFIGEAVGFGTVDLSFIGRALQNASPQAGDVVQRQQDGRLSWLGDALRLALFAALAYGVYRLGQLIFRRLDARRADNAEGDRSSITSARGLGGLLRAAFPGRPHSGRDDGRWMQRHAVYRLYGRVLGDSAERRFAARPGETPLEFARASALALQAPVFESVAAEFDRARYGGHFPSDDELRPVVEGLRAWESEHPVTDEIRNRPGRDEEAPDIDVDIPTQTPQAPVEQSPI